METGREMERGMEEGKQKERDKNERERERERESTDSFTCLSENNNTCWTIY